MTYELRFHELALQEWEKLDGSIRTPFKKNWLSGLKILGFRHQRFRVCPTVTV